MRQTRAKHTSSALYWQGRGRLSRDNIRAQWKMDTRLLSTKLSIMMLERQRRRSAFCERPRHHAPTKFWSGWILSTLLACVIKSCPKVTFRVAAEESLRVNLIDSSTSSALLFYPNNGGIPQAKWRVKVGSHSSPSHSTRENERQVNYSRDPMTSFT